MVAGLADGSIHPNAEKRRLARAVVDLYHGAGAGETAEDAFDRVFKQHDVPEDIPEVSLPVELVREGRIWLPKVLVAAGLASSNAEARRAVEQGGVRLDGEPLTDPDAEVAVDTLVGAVLQLGRRRFARIVSIG